MLFELILIPIFSLVRFLLSLVPSFSLPGGFLDSFDALVSLILGASYFLPLPQIGLALLVLVYFHFAHFIIAGAGWLLRKVPGLG